MAETATQQSKQIQSFDKTKIYTAREALEIIKSASKTKFDETVELHVNLGIDTKKSEQHVRGTIAFEYDLGKKITIAAFVTPEHSEEAKNAGADIVGGKELIDQIKQTEKINFDIAIAEPAIMKDLAMIAKILGPKGIMPSPKNETVTANIARAIKDLKKGKVSFKSDEGGIIHIAVGKRSWENEKIQKNISSFLDALKRLRPKGIKGNFIKTIYLCATMGKAVKIES
ncbi:MAG: 50S ribosomal protein L1 [Parcubacteria group bacterium]|nr:50S ribosomal protein L1 [Parcubacteria group bacterium]